MDDIYRTGRALESARRTIQSDPGVADADRAPFLRFLDDGEQRGLSAVRLVKYARVLIAIAREFPGPVTAMTEDSVRAYVRTLEGSERAAWTKHDYKLQLKLFARWLRGGENYPPEVRWVRTRVRHTESKLPDALFSADEVLAMVRKAECARDRALITALYESGMRIGELLTMRLGNVMPARDGMALQITGKTGPRRILVVHSAPYLAAWLAEHPQAGDPQAPVWVGVFGKARGRRMRYDAARMVLARAARGAGIAKRIHPHLLRHSRASFLANHLKEAQMNGYFGWVQGSDMTRTYVHLSGRDIDDAIRAVNGIRDVGAEQPLARASECPRCRTRLMADAVSCPNCWLPLQARVAPKAEPDDPNWARLGTLMERLLQNRKFVALLAEEKAKAEADRRPPGAVWPKTGANQAA